MIKYKLSRQTQFICKNCSKPHTEYKQYICTFCGDTSLCKKCIENSICTGKLNVCEECEEKYNFCFFNALRNNNKTQLTKNNELFTKETRRN